MYVFYCIFAQFMQFPVLHFGLDHYASQPFIFYIFRGPTTSDNHHCTGVVHYERAATVLCYTSSSIGMYFACHALEDLASAGNMVDVMR